MVGGLVLVCGYLYFAGVCCVLVVMFVVLCLLALWVVLVVWVGFGMWLLSYFKWFVRFLLWIFRFGFGCVLFCVLRWCLFVVVDTFVGVWFYIVFVSGGCLVLVFWFFHLVFWVFLVC